MKIITTIVLLVVFSNVQAQTIDYGYDSAGNRESRTHTSSSDAISESDNMLENLAFDDILALVEETIIDEDEFLDDKSIKFSVYPNPMVDKLCIFKSMNGLTDISASFLLFDSKGKIINKKLTSDNQVFFNVNHIAKGIYYVFYFDKNERKAWRVIKE